MSKTTIFWKNYRKINLLRLCSIFILLVSILQISNGQGFRVSGNQLLDANGNNFVMKGFNIPTAWFVSDVNNNIANMKAKTGANCMRIVVTTSTADAAWQTSVTNCIANKVIPMVELHDVTGNNSPSELNRMAQFWASKSAFLKRSDIAKHILINIANEWGDWYMSATATGTPSRVTWRDAYKTAITTIRNSGINTTLVIDAPGYGQDNKTQSLLAYAKELQAHDPQKNCLFSIHMYCEWAVGGNSSITSLLPAVKNAGIPVIVGEFGYQHDNGGGSVCDINESQVISTANSNGIGWLAWSWKGNGSGVGYLDLSSDWAGNSLSGWGNTVVNGSGGTKTASNASVFSTSTGGGCTATAIVPYMQVNGGTWQNVSTVSARSGQTIKIGPQPVTGGSWSWTGCGLSGTAREQTFTRTSSCTATATYTNSCGTKSTRAFTVNITAARESAEILAEETPLASPNPSNSIFTINQQGKFNYLVHDLTGKAILDGKGENKVEFGEKLNVGLYILRVQTSEITRTQKIIKY